jgi:hypothetical protein
MISAPPSSLFFILIIVALLAIAGAYWNSLLSDARRAKVSFISAQLKYLYGPLYAMSHASETAWETFRKQHRHGRAFVDPANPPTQAEIDEWVRWVRLVFTPMNERMVNTIIEHTDLIDGRMPTAFLELVAHVEGYKAVLDKWGQGDFTEFNSAVNFPREFNSKIKNTFEILSERRAKLMR